MAKDFTAGAAECLRPTQFGLATNDFADIEFLRAFVYFVLLCMLLFSRLEHIPLNLNEELEGALFCAMCLVQYQFLRAGQEQSANPDKPGIHKNA